MTAHASHSRPRAQDDTAHHVVRPRWVWLGLVLTLLGCGLLGLAASVGSVPAGVVGLVALVGGATVAVRAGVQYDVHSSSPAQEVRQVIEGDVHEGVAPGDQVASELARRTARDLTGRTQRLHEERQRMPRPPLAPIGAVVVIAVAVFLMLAQWEIYPLGRTSQDNARRALLVAVIAMLAGLRILVAQPARHGVACLLLFLCGAALVAQAGLFDHEIAATAGVEAVTGVLVLAASLVCAFSPSPGLATVAAPTEADGR